MKKTFKVGQTYRHKDTKMIFKCVQDPHPWDRTKRLEYRLKRGGSVSVHVSDYTRSDFVIVK